MTWKKMASCEPNWNNSDHIKPQKIECNATDCLNIRMRHAMISQKFIYHFSVNSNVDSDKNVTACTVFAQNRQFPLWQLKFYFCAAVNDVPQ